MQGCDIKFKDPELKSLSEVLQKAWDMIPKDKQEIYGDVFWVIRHANELDSFQYSEPAEKICGRYWRACALKDRIDGFMWKHKLQWEQGLNEVDRMSSKLRQIGWTGLFKSIRDVLKQCEQYRLDYVQLRKAMVAEGGK